MAAPETGVVQPPQKVTVGFERSVQVRPYETAKASIFVSQDVAGTYNDQGLFVPEEGAIHDSAIAAFYEAKVAVLKQLNITYETIDNVVLENLDKHLGPIDVVGTRPAPALKTPPQTLESVGHTTSGDWRNNAPDTKEAQQAELLAHPDRWWDNREGKRNPKSPDFKRKSNKGEERTAPGIWLDKASPELQAKYAA